MDRIVEEAVSRAAAVMVPDAPVPGASWRWGTVVADNGATLDVEVGGSVLYGVPRASDVTAPVGARVRVAYLVTDALVDASVGQSGEATATVNLSNIGSGTKTMTLTRVGDVVHASMTATATAGTANSAISCGTVPSGYRPAQTEFQSGTCVTNNTLSGYFRWRVATTGAITYWCSVTAIRESPLCMTWVTSDTFPS